MTLQNFPLRIDKGLRARLERLAEHEGRRVSELARELLRAGVENRTRALAELGDPVSNTQDSTHEAP